MLVFLYN